MGWGGVGELYCFNVLIVDRRGNECCFATDFCNITCNIIAVIIIYRGQLWYSRKKLKQDRICSELKLIDLVLVSLADYLTV